MDANNLYRDKALPAGSLVIIPPFSESLERCVVEIFVHRMFYCSLCGVPVTPSVWVENKCQCVCCLLEYGREQ